MLQSLVSSLPPSHSLSIGLAHRRCFPWYANELNYLFYHKWFCLSNLEIASSSVNQPQAAIPYLFSATNSVRIAPAISDSVSIFISISDSNFQLQPERCLSIALGDAISFHCMLWLGISSLVCFMLYPLEFFLQLLGSRATWPPPPSTPTPSPPSPSQRLSCLWPPLFKEPQRTERRLDSFASGRIFWRYLSLEISHSSCQISCVFIYHRRGSLSLLSL